MLFDVRPKTSIKDLFGRKAEYLMFKDAIKKNRNFILITGPRRIGKTSFLYASLNEIVKEGVPYVVIDARAATSLNSKYPQKVIAEHIYKVLSGRSVLSEVISRVKGIKLGPVELELKDKFDLIDVFAELNKIGKVIVAFDEAQYLRFANEDLTKFFAWVLDALQNIILVFTGSQVGVLEKFLRLYDGSSPLFGRYNVRIVLPRFNPSESLEFLERGFKEVGMDVREEELLSAIKTLNGIPGWLVHYGVFRVDGLTHEEAIERVLEEAMTYVISEFKELSKLSPRYEEIMKVVAELSEGSGGVKFEEIRKKTKINPRSLRNYINRLIDYGFLEPTGHGRYRIPDPVMFRVFKRL
ncbi:AAA family ATPase [Pyrococcus kukulkanii]|uniref:ATP-binding protein n=1 Tax=Pyrococcus kukulkanii TaxID=1609559 RepID=A0ABV4T2U8_9EURY